MKTHSRANRSSKIMQRAKASYVKVEEKKEEKPVKKVAKKKAGGKRAKKV